MEYRRDEYMWVTVVGEAVLTPWKENEPTGTSQVVGTSMQAAGASEVTVVVMAVAFVAATAAMAL